MSREANNNKKKNKKQKQNTILYNIELLSRLFDIEY